MTDGDKRGIHLAYETLSEIKPLHPWGHGVQTPNLDKLTVVGMLFTHCFANPACSPSRAEINTGKYQAFAGIKHVLTHWIFSKKDLELLGGYNQKLGQA